MAMGGGDPLAYLQRYRDRYWSFHLKDVVADRSHDTELGTGTLDFRRLLAAVPDIDHKFCYVEQEGASDPLASAKQDYEFLKKLEFRPRSSGEGHDLVVDHRGHLEADGGSVVLEREHATAAERLHPPDRPARRDLEPY